MKPYKIFIALITLLCLTACNTTQKERLEKIDSFFNPIQDKLSSITGSKQRREALAREQAIEDAYRQKQNEAYQQKIMARSPLIHKQIYEAGESNSFVFFYHGRDQSSARLGESLKRYVLQTGITMEAYTLDNRSIASFPRSVFADRNTIKKYFGTAEATPRGPILFLKIAGAPYTVPIATEEVSYLELIKRVNIAIEEHMNSREGRRYGY